jgi:hypothetical protein
MALGGRAQKRYESLRAYMLVPKQQRCRTSAARFDLSRFERFGLLGLLERDPIGEAWRSDRVGSFHVEVIAVGSADAAARRARLYQFLYQLASGPEGDTDDSRSCLRSRVDGHARERANDCEPARRRYSLRG